MKPGMSLIKHYLQFKDLREQEYTYLFERAAIIKKACDAVGKKGFDVGAYTAMCEQTRQQAYDEMVSHARQLGANAIVGMRYDGSSVESGSNGASEVLCYGTAVVVEPLAAGSDIN